MEKQTIRKVALAVFKDKKLIVVRSHKNPEVFYTLGGKIEPGESEIDCLKREVGEEVGCQLDDKSLKFLHEFEEVAHGKENTWLHIRMYIGKLIGTPQPSSEIAEVSWFDTATDKKHLSDMASRQIFPWLKANGYIK